MVSARRMQRQGALPGEVISATRGNHGQIVLADGMAVRRTDAEPLTHRDAGLDRLVSHRRTDRTGNARSLPRHTESQRATRAGGQNCVRQKDSFTKAHIKLPSGWPMVEATMKVALSGSTFDEHRRD